MKKLCSRTYTCYEECEKFGYTHISGEQFKKTREIIDSLRDNIFKPHSAGTSDYLIKGNILRTNHATSNSPDTGWCFKLYSETQQGLEKLAEELDLPRE